MVSSPKIKTCVLLLLIVVVLIQTDFIEAKGGRGFGRSISRSSSRSSFHGSATGINSGAGWLFSSGRGYHGHSSQSASRSSGSPGTRSSLFFIAIGVLTMVFVDAGRKLNYETSDVI